MIRFFTLCLLLPALLGFRSLQAQGSYALLPTQGPPNFSTSSRGPDVSKNFHRAVVIYPAADIQGVAPGTSFVSLSFQLRAPAPTAATGQLRVWMRRTTDPDYSLAPDWAYLLQLPAAFTLVYDGPLTVPAVAGWFDIQLQTPFGYTAGEGLYLAYEWVANTTAPAPAAYECNALRTQSLRAETGTTAAPPQLNQASNFRPVIRLGYSTPARDAAVVRVFSPGTMPLQGCVSPYPVQALVRNVGTLPLQNLPVTLTATGSATGSLTVTVPLLAPGASTTVYLPGLAPTRLGRAYLKVDLPADDNAANNQAQDSTLVTPRALTFATGTPTLATPFSTGSAGFDRTAGTLLCRFPLTAPALVSSVRLHVERGPGRTSEGNTVFAVLLDERGCLLARSADLLIPVGASSGWRDFPLPAPTLVRGRAFFAGLAQTVPVNNGPRYYPLGLQDEAPLRDSTYYSVVGDSALTGLKAPTELRTLGRFLIEVLLESAPLATQGPRALAGFELYPNPARNRVTLRWPAAGTVPSHAELLDLTGRRVARLPLPRGHASGTALDLPASLPAGTYLMRLVSPANTFRTQRLVVE
ncbi:T9SS type A sorting domain-containing protein [Hymenobacter koreensis]|uniref:T9SS type A sorting domain-containing protein n=1 Tax=Hymenobacter koreensis TaxID=1084523 RepID=A0ABP8IZU7_9BACT